MPASIHFNFFSKKFKFLPVFFLIWGVFTINQPVASAQEAQPAPDCKGVATLEQWYKKTDLWRFKNETCKPAPTVQAYSYTPIDAFELYTEFRAAHSKASDEVEKKYKYTLVTVKGTFLRKGSSFLGFPEVFFQTNNRYHVVLCQFSKADQELISSLQPGQYMVIRGTVKEWNKVGILAIEDCSFVEILSPADSIPKPTTIGYTPQSITYEKLLAKCELYLAGKSDPAEFIQFCTGISEDQDNTPQIRSFVLSHRARAYLNLGEIEKAKADVKTALEIDDSIPAPYQSMAYIYIRENNPAKVVEYFKKASEKENTEREKNVLRGVAQNYQIMTEAIPAKKLFAEITHNPFAAEIKYATGFIAVKGKVTKMGRDNSNPSLRVINEGNDQFTVTDSPNPPLLLLDAGGGKSVECQLTSSALPVLAKTQVGDEVRLACLFNKASDSRVQLNICSIWGQ